MNRADEAFFAAFVNELLFSIFKFGCPQFLILFLQSAHLVSNSTSFRLLKHFFQFCNNYVFHFVINLSLGFLFLSYLTYQK